MASVAGVDIFQSPYTPADLYIMAREKETLEWDRTCRIVEMIHNTSAEKPMAWDSYHPWRPSQKAIVTSDVKKMSVSQVRGRFSGSKKTERI